MVGMAVMGTGTEATITLEQPTTTMPVPTPTSPLRTAGCSWPAQERWAGCVAGTWAGRWRSSWSCSQGAEIGEGGLFSPWDRTLGGREPSRMTTRDFSSTCSAFPGTYILNSHAGTMTYLEYQSDDTHILGTVSNSSLLLK